MQEELVTLLRSFLLFTDVQFSDVHDSTAFCIHRIRSQLPPCFSASLICGSPRGFPNSLAPVMFDSLVRRDPLRVCYRAQWIEKLAEQAGRSEFDPRDPGLKVEGEH